MNFARRVFLIAGIYGVLVIAPMYFLEERLGRDDPPPITHAEFYYGFIGSALAWQILYLVLSRDPQRFRPLMPVAIFAKLTFGIAAPILFAMGRASGTVTALASVDLLFAALFAAAYVQTAIAER